MSRNRLCYVGLVVAIAEHSKSTLLYAYPSYASTQALDELRASEYPALATHTYLDFTAANLYASSQIARHLELLQQRLLCNPHSTNPFSSVATEYITRTPPAVLRFFYPRPVELDVVFVCN